MRTLSCDPARLYADSGIYQEYPAIAEAVRSGPAVGSYLATVFDAYAYERPMPETVIDADEAAAAKLLETYREWNQLYSRGSPSDLFALENAVLYDRSLYVPNGGEWVQIYETNRALDRHWKSDLDVGLLQSALRPSNREVDYVYFSGVGSENYAHWLVDDLTRAKALAVSTAGRRWEIVLDRYFPAIDGVREASLRALGPPFDEIGITFVDKKKPYFFDRIAYVSPASYHPYLKCAEALQFLRDRLRAGRPRAGPKALFVGRNALWRNLLNADEVEAFFAERSFEILTIDWKEPLPFVDQVERFAQADVVVGVAGASMVNTMFCKAGTRIFCLAGAGFVDPFFWDLAAVMSHPYHVCFGTPWKPEKPEFSSFSIERDQLEELARWL